MARQSPIEYAPVGEVLENGYDLGGARIYPWSTSLAISPPAYYSDYIGSGQGVPVTPPVASLSALSGTSGAPSHSPGVAAAVQSPLGRQSPLPWVVGGLLVAVFVMHHVHYK
jgi:hypothetical protein